MRWKGRERSENVRDHRGAAGKVAVGGGGLGVLLITLLVMFAGGDPEDVRNIVGQQQPGAVQQQPGPGINDESREFIEVILKSTEDIWSQQFQQAGLGAYREPVLNLFSGRINSQCGAATAAVGPFYCPADKQVYIDPAFFEDLKRRHRAPGDFAQAYVIAHEVAHHVQSMLPAGRGMTYSQIVQRVRSQGDEVATNQASVRLELQADFLAGVWAHYAARDYDLLEPGDIEEGINAANQIGDDTLMRQAGARVIPERFTHGTSAQRVRWFAAGLRSGDMAACSALFEVPYKEL